MCKLKLIKRSSIKKFQMTLHFHNVLMLDMQITQHSDFVSTFELTMVSNNHTCDLREASDDFSPDSDMPNAPLFRLYESGLLSSSPDEGRRSSNPHPFRPYGKWSHLCSGLPYEGGRPYEPSPLGYYHPRFPPYTPFLAPYGFCFPSPPIPCFFHLLEGLSPFLILSHPFEVPNFLPHMTCPICPSLLWLSRLPSPLGISSWFRVWQPSIPRVGHRLCGIPISLWVGLWCSLQEWGLLCGPYPVKCWWQTTHTIISHEQLIDSLGEEAKELWQCLAGKVSHT